MSYTPTLPRRMLTKAMLVALPSVLGCAIQMTYLGVSAFPYELPEQAKKEISPFAAAINCALGWIGLLGFIVVIVCASYCAYRTREIDIVED